MSLSEATPTVVRRPFVVPAGIARVASGNVASSAVHQKTVRFESWVPDEAAPLLASWSAGIGGTDWLRRLIESRTAIALGGDGYTDRFAVTAGPLAELLRPAPPMHAGPLVLGEDYARLGGWIGTAKIAIDLIQDIDPHEILIVEAWDQS